MKLIKSGKARTISFSKKNPLFRQTDKLATITGVDVGVMLFYQVENRVYMVP